MNTDRNQNQMPIQSIPIVNSIWHQSIKSNFQFDWNQACFFSRCFVKNVMKAIVKYERQFLIIMLRAEGFIATNLCGIHQW